VELMLLYVLNATMIGKDKQMVLVRKKINKLMTTMNSGLTAKVIYSIPAKSADPEQNNLVKSSNSVLDASQIM